MNFKEGFIVCDKDFKNQLLKSKKDGFYNYIYLSESELINKLTFEIDNKAILFLNKEFSLSYQLAKVFINNMKWVEDKFYNNPKIDSIVTAYKALVKNGLVKVNNLFPLRLKQFPLTFINPINTKEYLKLKSIVSNYTSVEEVYFDNTEVLPKVYELKTITDEVLFVCNEIMKLLKNGISLNDIYIAGADEKYIFLFKRLAKHYNITMEFPAIKNINSSKLCKDFISLSLTKDSYEDVINELDHSDNVFDKIFNLIQTYGLQNEKPKDYIDFFTYIFKNTTYLNIRYNSAIHFVDDSYTVGPKSYLFYVGFNLGKAPRIVKDDDYLTDKELTILGLTTSIERNALNKNKLINFIHQNNVVITYKSIDDLDKAYPSPLIKELKLDVIKPQVQYGYSKIEDELRLAKHYDEFIKFSEVHDDLAKYGIQEIRYQKFDHLYKPIDKKVLDRHFTNRKLSLSYSSSKTFFACPFAYYADRILGLNEYQTTLATRLGVFAHRVLEESYDDNFNFNESVKASLLANAVDGKDRFYFMQMKNILCRLIEFNKKHEELSELKNIVREVNIVVSNEGYSFEGFIDKLMYTIIDDQVYAVIVDYKTGKDVISLDNIEYGLHLQLPAYMYLLSKYEPFAEKKINIIGIYLQKVNIIALDGSKDIDNQIESNFRLQGFSVTDLNMLKRFDPNFAKSTYIRSMSLTKEGINKRAKLFAHKQQNEMVDLVAKLLDRASEDIHNGNFKIAPKMIDGVNQSCKYCKYVDICFYDTSDVVELENKPFKESV